MFGTGLCMGLGCVWDLAVYGTELCMGLGCVRDGLCSFRVASL